MYSMDENKGDPKDMMGYVFQNARMGGGRINASANQHNNTNNDRHEKGSKPLHRALISLLKKRKVSFF